jgi:putative transcriptional regulator
LKKYEILFKLLTEWQKVIVMDANLFRSLAESLKQAAAISKGEDQASRVTTLEKKSAAPGQEHLVAATVGMVHAAVDARAVREKTGLSQSDFAVVMNVSVKTLQNWEQHRREPTGPAEALLKIVYKEPKLALLALHS